MDNLNEKSYTGIEVIFNYMPNTNECDQFNPITGVIKGNILHGFKIRINFKGYKNPNRIIKKILEQKSVETGEIELQEIKRYETAAYDYAHYIIVASHFKVFINCGLQLGKLIFFINNIVEEV